MKKILASIIGVLLLLPICANAQEPVKVYIFEAGGCPACEAQINYLEGLDSYNDKFVIVHKQAYVDHVDWAQGEDFELAKTVADAFKDNGFKDATYTATPFVVVSNVYAAAGYNASLETVINEAYEKGDVDVVSCFEQGGTDCLKLDNEAKTNNNDVIWAVIICSLLLGGLYYFKSNSDTKKILAKLNR